MLRDRILRLPEVEAITGLKKSTLYRRMAAGEFPQQVKLGGSSCRAVGWLAEEVYAWIDGLRRG